MSQRHHVENTKIDVVTYAGPVNPDGRATVQLLLSYDAIVATATAPTYREAADEIVEQLQAVIEKLKSLKD